MEYFYLITGNTCKLYRVVWHGLVGFLERGRNRNGSLRFHYTNQSYLDVVLATFNKCDKAYTEYLFENYFIEN